MSFLKKYCSNIIGQDPSVPKMKLPFGLRLGGIVDINTTFFIFNSEKTAMKDPGDKLYIEAISSFNRKDCNIYNLYVGSEAGEDYILQVDFDKDFKLCAAKLFQQTFEILPQDRPELDEWETRIIGDEFIRLPDGTEYDRVWEQGRRGHVDGYKLQERLYSTTLDSYNEMRRLMMLYSRNLDADTKEYLMASSNRSTDKNFISVAVGIHLDPENLKFN